MSKREILKNQKDETLNRLRHAVIDGNPILFLGAGAAIYEGYAQENIMPDGYQIRNNILKTYYNSEDVDIKILEDKFCNEFGVKANITSDIVWGRILSRRKKFPFFYRALNQIVNKKPIPPNYRFVARLCLNDIINIVVTTNFDEKLDSAFNETLQEEQLLTKTLIEPPIVIFAKSNDDFEYSHFYNIPNAKIIYKLHGSLSHPYTIISSAQDMEKNNKLSEPKQEILTGILDQYFPIIIIGYSGNDDDIYNTFRDYPHKDKNEMGEKFYWVNKEPPSAKIKELLKLYKSDNNVIQMSSYDFLLRLSNLITPKSHLHPPEKTFVLKHRRDTNKRELEIRDPVFGKLEFPDEHTGELLKLTDSAQFQRLRDIRQLSFVHYQYPGATHTRFMHSLGVAYLVAKAVGKIKLKKPLSFDEKRAIIIAGLLHDIGHGPFGHVLDKLKERLGKKGGLYDVDRTIQEIESTYSTLDLKETLDSVNIARSTVKEILENKHRASQLVSKHALDLDRVDFILRDSFYTGKFLNAIKKLRKQINSNINNQPLTQNERIKIVGELVSRMSLLESPDSISNKESPKLVLSFSESIKGLVYSLLELYVQLHIQVYTRSIVLCAEAMIAKALQWAIEVGEIDFSTIHRYTDTELFALLERSSRLEVQNLVWAVKYRILFSEIASSNIIPDYNSSAIENEIKGIFDIKEDNYKNLFVVAITPDKKIGPLYFGSKKAVRENCKMYDKKLTGKRRVFVFAPHDGTLFNKQSEVKDILKNMLLQKK